MRGAYERGRARDAAVATIPVLLLPVVGIGLAEGAVGAVVASVVLVGGFVILRWRGQSWSQGAVVGVVAGGVAAGAPFCILLDGSGCVATACAAWCIPVCGGAGVVAGVIVGTRSRDLRALVSGGVLAAAAAALGCWPLGLGMVVSAGAAIVAGAVGARIARTALGA
jgi:hypothetical protein